MGNEHGERYMYRWSKIPSRKSYNSILQQKAGSAQKLGTDQIVNNYNATLSSLDILAVLQSILSILSKCGWQTVSTTSSPRF